MLEKPLARGRLWIALVFGVAAAAWLGTAARTPTAGAQAQELLANPGAEEGMLLAPSGWDTTVAGLPTVRFEWSRDEAFEGDRSLHVYNASGVVPMWHNWHQNLAGKNYLAGRELVFRARVKSKQLPGNAYLLLQAYRDTVMVQALAEGVPRLIKRNEMGYKPADDPQLELGWARKYVTGTHEEWTPLEVRLFVPPSTNLIVARAGVFGAGDVYFDDFSLTAVPAKPENPFPVNENLLVDPGFEGDLTDWDYSLAPDDALKLRISDVAHGGKQSVLLDSQSRPGFQIVSHVFQVWNTRQLSGKRVRLSGWVRTAELDRAQAYLRIFATGSYGTHRHPISESWSGTRDWTFTSVETVIPEDSYTVWAQAGFSTGVGKVWWDDLEFVVLGDEKKKRAGRS